MKTCNISYPLMINSFHLPENRTMTTNISSERSVMASTPMIEQLVLWCAITETWFSGTRSSHTRTQSSRWPSHVKIKPREPNQVGLYSSAPRYSVAHWRVLIRINRNQTEVVINIQKITFKAHYSNSNIFLFRTIAFWFLLHAKSSRYSVKYWAGNNRIISVWFVLYYSTNNICSYTVYIS